ncbi:hypothetical protein EON63_24670, partial [archaeon]
MRAFVNRSHATPQPPQPTTSTASSHPPIAHPPTSSKPSASTARYEEISRLSAGELASVGGVFELLQQGRYR